MENIYHEKQEGQLCGLHCVNNLLQSAYFTEFDLAMIANQIDQQERETMAEGGTNSEEYRKFINNPSRNMDDTGFFSIQVITKALKVWNLDLVVYNSKHEVALLANADPTSQKAYICNYNLHWFTIRKIGNQWFNLNSLLTFPELISTTYLGLFLKQLQQEGYSIFIVIGNFPICKSDEVLSKITVEQKIKPQLIGKEQKNKNFLNSAEDDSLNLAIQQSLLQSNEDSDRHLKTAISLSMQEACSSNIEKTSSANSLENLTEEQLLEKAIKLSMEQ